MEIRIQKSNDFDASIIANVNSSIFGKEIAQEIEAHGLQGAYRNDEGKVVIIDAFNDEIETSVEISPDGYVFA